MASKSPEGNQGNRICRCCGCLWKLTALLCPRYVPTTAVADVGQQSYCGAASAEEPLAVHTERSKRNTLVTAVSCYR